MDNELTHLFLFATWLTGSGQHAENLLAKALHNTNMDQLPHLSCIEKLRKIYRFHRDKSFALYSNLPYDRQQASMEDRIAALPTDSRVALGLQTVLNKSPEEIGFIMGQNVTHVRQDLAFSRALLIKHNS